MISVSRTLCAVAKKAFGSSNRSGENEGENSAWYLILDAMDAASCAKGLKVPEISVKKKKLINSRIKSKSMVL